MTDVQITSEEVLEQVDDFLTRLVVLTGMRGYFDPEAGEVSTLFVLAGVRALRENRPWKDVAHDLLNEFDAPRVA